MSPQSEKDLAILNGGAPEAKEDHQQKAKDMLTALRKQIEIAKDEPERRDLSDMAKIIESKLAQKKARTEEIADSASDALAEAKAEFSSKQHSHLQKIESGMGTALEKTKEGVAAAKEKGGQLAVAATEKIGGKEAADALKSGDYKKAAAVVGEKVEFAGKAATIVMSLEQMANEIEEQLPFFGAIIAWFLRFFAGLAKGFLPQVDKDKIDAAKKGAKDALGQAQDVVNQTIEGVSGMDREKARAEAIFATKSYVEKNFFHGYELTPDRQKAFEQAMRDHQFPNEAISEIAQKYVKGEKVSVSEMNGIVEKYVFSNSLVVLRLAIAGVIPLNRLGFAIVEESASTSKKHFALTLGSLGIEPSHFGFDELQTLADQYKGDPEKRATMLYMLYKPASIFASISGAMIGGAMSLGVGFATKTTVDSIKMGADVLKGHTSGDYKVLIQNFADLEGKLGSETKYASQLFELEKLTATAKNNYVLLQALEDEAKVPGSFKANAQVRTLLSPEALKELDTMKTGSGYREFVRRQMASSPALGTIESIRNWATKMGGSASGRIIEHTEKLRGILDVQSRLAAQESKMLRWLEIMKDIGRTASVSRVQDVTTLMVKDEQSLKELAPAFLKLGSEGMKHFFNGIPLIGLAVGTHDLTKDSEKQRSLMEWGKMVGSALSMPFAGFVLVGNVKVSKDGVENVEQGLIGATLLTASGVYMMKNPRSAIQFATGITTLKQAGETISAGIRGVRVVGKVAPRLGEALAKAGAEAMERPGNIRAKLAGGAIAAALALYVAYGNDPYDKAMKEGFVDAATGNLSKKGHEKLASLAPEARKEILDAVAYQHLKKDGMADIETSYEPGSYNVIARTEEQAKKLQPIINRFSDALAGHGVGVVEVPVVPKA